MDPQKEISNLLQTECSQSEWEWVLKILEKDLSGRKIGFVMAHRFIPREPISAGKLQVGDGRYHIDLTQWTRDQLVRVFLLLSMDEGQENAFHETINQLFSTSDSRESQAIYSGISLFNYGPSWKFRATEAIRSNVGLIFDAMAFNNPYPAMYFDDSAWNQLVLKTIFSDKTIWKITGLEDRRNRDLARSISDFAHERWAAGRTLPPEVWYLTTPFPNDIYWQDAERLISSESLEDQIAGYLIWKSQAVQAPEPFRQVHEEILTRLESQDPDWTQFTTAAT